MPYKYSGRILRVGKSFKDNDGVLHPAQWATAWTDEEKQAKGIVWEDDPAPFDSRFYWGFGIEKALEDKAEVDEDGDPVLDEKGQQVITKGLRTQLIEKVKAQAGAMLAETDWMVVRAAEGIKPVSQAILDHRQAIRDKSDAIEAAISVCGTIDDIIMLHTVPTDADGNPTGNAPINDWPEEV